MHIYRSGLRFESREHGAEEAPQFGSDANRVSEQVSMGGAVVALRKRGECMQPACACRGSKGGSIVN